jgi:hypothetical protein
MNFALTIIGLASAIIAGAPLWAEIAADPINAANFARIKPGMTRAEVEKVLGGPGDEGQGEGQSYPVSWQGRGRNVIIIHFQFVKRGRERATDSKIFFNPSLWDRAKEWWGGYELHPDGSRSTRLESAA